MSIYAQPHLRTVGLFVGLGMMALMPMNAAAATISFDDAATTMTASLEGSSYAGFSWVNFDVHHQDYFKSFGLPSGLDNGVISPQYTAANHREGYAILQSPQPFDFLGANFTSLGKNNARITIEGYRPGDTLGDVSSLGTPSFVFSTLFSANAPTSVNVDFTNIIALKFLAFRWDDIGTTTNAYPAFGTYGDFFLMDNMVVSVPEPNIALLIVLGMMTVLGIRRRPANRMSVPCPLDPCSGLCRAS
jgi:hypothetical protein